MNSKDNRFNPVLLKVILENKQEGFTAHQKTIILELRDFLRRHGMSKLIKNPELGLAFLDEKLPYYAKHFNKEQLNILIESPYLNKNMLISTFDRNSIAIIAPPMEGGYCTCIYDLGCPGPGNDCENEGCTVNSDYEMCGLFGTSNCKRRCTGVEPHL